MMSAPLRDRDLGFIRSVHAREQQRHRRRFRSSVREATGLRTSQSTARAATTHRYRPRMSGLPPPRTLPPVFGIANED